MSSNVLQLSLACESFNQHARICHQCADVGLSFRRGDVPCSTGDAINRPIRDAFKKQQHALEKDFPGVDQDVIIDFAMSGPAYNLLSFLNERRRERVRNSPIMSYAIPVPTNVRPSHRQPTQIEVGGRRYGGGGYNGHSRTNSDTSTNPSMSPPQQSFYYQPQPQGQQYLGIPSNGRQQDYYVERGSGHREKKHVRFDSR